MKAKSLLICFWMLVLTLACSMVCQSSPRDADFQLIILKQDWHDLDLGYDAQKAFPILRAADTGDSLFVIDLEEIEVYDWDRQTITLTKDTTKALASVLDDQGELGEEVEAVANMKKSLGWGNPFEYGLHAKAFVIQAEGSSLYGGVFLDAVSQMAIDYPVARVMVDDDKVTIALLPIHLPFVMIDPIDGAGNVRELSIAEEAEEDVQQLNEYDDFLTGWIKAMATSDCAKELRRLVRDERIKAVFEVSGKLKE